jgi:hypothetical protein
MIAGRIPLTVALLLVAFPCAAAPSQGSFEISARGGMAVWVDGRRELVAMVGLTIPFDRVARPPRAAKTDEDAPVDAPAAQSAEAPAPVSDFRPSPPRLSLALARATLGAAFRAAGRTQAARRFASLASRARASAILPELRLRAAKTTDQSLRLAPTTNDPYRYTQAGGVTVSLEAQATWRLDRLVFADEEVRIEHLRRLRANADAALAEKVLKALFRWQRALLDAERPDLVPEERALAELGALEAELELDRLTGGWFGRHAAIAKDAGSE